MSDEESLTVAVPAPSRPIGEEQKTTISQNENPVSRQPCHNVVLRTLRRLRNLVREKFKRSAPENSTRKVGDYTSRAFLNLPTPMPVYDVLVQKPRGLIILRGLQRVGVLYVGIFGITYSIFYFSLFVVIYFLLRLRWSALPELSQLVIMALNVGQKIWEWTFARILLKPDWETATKFWWYIYLIISPYPDFEANYMRAWAENAVDSQKKTLIFVGDEELSIPRLEGDELDRARLQHLRMFYRLLKLRRGLIEVILPRTLVRIEWVKIEDASHVLGERMRTMDLGRRTGTLVARFHYPSLVEEGSKKLAEEESSIEQSFKQNPKNDGVSVGIEFVRRYNRNAITGVVSIPPLASLIFAAIWMSWFLTREKDDKYDPQVIVTTALTGALYLVTAGALGIALIAYLDTTVDDDSPKLRDVVDAIASMSPK